MAIYTASYFQPENHHGSLVSISRSHPRFFQVNSHLPFLAPSETLLKAWNRGYLTEAAYIDRYRNELQQSWPQVNGWLASLTPVVDCTLLCWERSGEFCHRNLVMQVIRKHRSDCYGGCDIPVNVGLLCAKCQSPIIPGVDRCYCSPCEKWMVTPKSY
jgi:uncharacterized protein YeaO (DUF488 family)